MKRIVCKLIILVIMLCGITFVLYKLINKNNKIVVDLSNLTYKIDNNSEDIKVYNQSDYNRFLSDYKSLPDIYITKFLYDGAGMYKSYDLDDFIEKGNDVEVNPLELTVININTCGDIYFTGNIIGGMIALNSNYLDNDVNIILNNVNIDTDSKKVPAIYVYNKDINYTKHKVTIKLNDDTNNYISGGKFKKVSLIAKEELDNFKDKYINDASSWFSTYQNYYGVYSKDEIDKVLFAKVEADKEDLEDGDPYYFYKGAGAISSDIDLYFEGSGYLEVTSKNKEGIESKGNLSLGNGNGDYKIVALDDCLNTTTDGNDARNKLSINVNSLSAIVSNDANEGDAIDSNGILEINGGLIIALAKSGSDAGLDSSRGSYINSGTVLATGDMFDEINSDSKQQFMLLSFSSNVNENELITLLDSTDGPIFSYKTDRNYRNLLYSSNNISDGTYYLYSNGNIVDDEINGYYSRITSYEKGILLGYSSNDNHDFRGNMNDKIDIEDIPKDGEMVLPNNRIDKLDNKDINNKFDIIATNKDFIINGISNTFNGVAKYFEQN